MRYFLLSLAVVLLFGNPAHAGIINGDFETGDFTGWTVLGGTAEGGSNATVQLIDGSEKAVLESFSGGGFVQLYQDFSFDGASPKTLSFEYSGQFTSQGLISLGIGAGAVPPNYNSFPHFSLYQTFGPGQPSGESATIPLTVASITVYPGVDYVIGFTLARDLEQDPSSGTLVIDNVQIVPEPSSLLLVLCGAMTLALAAMRTARR